VAVRARLAGHCIGQAAANVDRGHRAHRVLVTLMAIDRASFFFWGVPLPHHVSAAALPPCVATGPPSVASARAP
jgi:hypothetical protein